MNLIARSVTVLVVAGLAVTGLAACSSDTSSSSASSESSQLIGPISEAISSIDGKTIDATVGRNINLTGDDKTFDQWTATTSTPGIVTFKNGYTEGSATFNPGLTVDAAGTTKVTLKNSSTGQTVTFTVNATK